LFSATEPYTIKAGKSHNTWNLKGVNMNMKWHPFLSTSILNKMRDIIKNDVRTGKGYTEVHLKNLANKMFEFMA
jgi:hypothetical protein